MTLDTKEIISVSDANKNFSKATRIADKTGKAVILKGNRPKYLLLDIEADPRLILSDDELIAISAKYSLQGTTQGRYLTGGVPPVRFSM